MSYETPLVEWHQDRSEEDDQGRSYFAGGTVIASSRGEAYAALDAFGVIVGEEFADYPGCPCNRREVNRHGSGDLYDWVGEFKGAADDGSTDPTNRPIYVEWREGKETIASSYDINGQPLMSSSRERLEPREHTLDTFVVTIYKWETHYNARKRLDYSNTCNSDAVHLLNYDLNPGEVALRSYTPTDRIQYRASGEQVTLMVEVAYVLELRGTLKDGDGNDLLDGDICTGFYDRKADVGRLGFYIDPASSDTKLGRIGVKAADGSGFSPISSPVPLLDGIPIDPDNVYLIENQTSDNWVVQPRDAGVVYDDSRPRVAYIITPKLIPVPYATLLDS